MSWYLLVVRRVNAIDPLSVPIGQKIPQRVHLEMSNAFGTEDVARAAGKALLSKEPTVVRVIKVMGEEL